MISDETKNILSNWWEFGEQKNPCIIASIPQKTAVKIPDTDDLSKFWTDTDFILSRKMAEINATEYLGLAAPFHYVDQGSSAMACALGCQMRFIDKETVWAEECLKSVEEVLDLSFDPKSSVYQRISEITAKSADLAKGHHYLAPFALEGMTDLMAAFYGIENFLVDLIDKPEEVEKAMELLKNIWIKAFADIQKVIGKSGNKGGIGWVGIWAPGTTFPLQEDVAYNLSPDMFRHFCIPHIRDLAATMEYPFFHLDGIGMIPHLDALLEIQELKAIQWQPGAGKEAISQWHGLVKRIVDAGKSVQVYAEPEEVEPLVREIGTRGLLVILEGGDREKVLRLLDRYPQNLS